MNVAPYTLAEGAGTITMWKLATGAFRVTGTFLGGGVAHRNTRRGAERVVSSMRRWWARHQENYLLQRRCAEDPGDRLPRGWAAPSDRGGRA